MTVKAFNIDALVENSKRIVTFNGTDHPVIELNFDSFVKSLKDSKQIAKNEDGSDDEVGQMEANIAFIQRSVPTIETSDLKNLSFAHLSGLSDFILGELDKDLKTPDAVQAAKDANAERGDEKPGKVL